MVLGAMILGDECGLEGDMIDMRMVIEVEVTRRGFRARCGRWVCVGRRK